MNVNPDSGLAAEIFALLPRLKLPPGESLPPGVSEEVLRGLEFRLGVQLPAAYRDWLMLCNGPLVGPGGMFGVNPTDADYDLETAYARNPHWKSNGWLPIADDGFGNAYFLVMPGRYKGGEPVIFVESICYESTVPVYIAASGLWRFLRFFFRKELGLSAWPFDEQAVVLEDPEILNYPEIPLPWTA